MLNEAYKTVQEVCNEGHALLDEVGSNNDFEMNDETAHKKRATPDS
jgi:hypothetical protein